MTTGVFVSVLLLVGAFVLVVTATANPSVSSPLYQRIGVMMALAAMVIMMLEPER